MVSLRKRSAARAAALIGSCLVPLSFAHYDPLRDFCRRWGHQTAVVDNRLYVDGGWVNWKPFNEESNNFPNPFFIYSDLDTQTERMPTLRSNLSKDASVPNVAGGVLWEDSVNKRLFLFGGETFGTPIPFTLYSYDILEDKWGPFGEPQQSSNIMPTSYGAGVSVSSRGEAYYYGGWISASSMVGWKGEKQATDRLVKYHMDTNRWTNLAGPDNIPRAEGSMVYIPAGDDGMLVYFGGIQDPQKNGTSIPQPLDQIFLFDIANSKWYGQRTTGRTPENRRQFCAGAAWAEDRSSYNIYIYGGAGFPGSTAGFDDIYILSLPSFQWIRGPYPPNSNVMGQYPKSQMSCNVVNNAQMIIIGGYYGNDTSYSCDAELVGGQHNMDLGKQNPEDAIWAQYKPTLTTYVVPTEIITAVGGQGTGGAQMTAPLAGFDAHDLSVLMTRRAASSTRTATRDVNIATAASVEDKQTLSTGAIAGIAAGGGVALILCLTGCCVFIRRRRRHYKNPRIAAKAIPPSPWSPVSPMSPDTRDFSPDSNKDHYSFPSPGTTLVSHSTMPPTPAHTRPAELHMHTIPAELHALPAELETQYHVELETEIHVQHTATSSSTPQGPQSPFWRLSPISPLEMQTPTPPSTGDSWIRRTSIRRTSNMSHSTTGGESGVAQHEQPSHPQLQQINFETLSESLRLKTPNEPQASPVPACLIPAAGTSNSQLPSPADSPLMSPERPRAESPASQGSAQAATRKGPRHSWRNSASSSQAGSNVPNHRARLSKASRTSRNSQQ
ncbi:hypothetical protein OQA88_5341 [Cercophora sp. LCS_1]